MRTRIEARRQVAAAPTALSGRALGEDQRENGEEGGERDKADVDSAHGGTPFSSTHSTANCGEVFPASRVPSGLASPAYTWRSTGRLPCRIAAQRAESDAASNRSPASHAFEARFDVFRPKTPLKTHLRVSRTTRSLSSASLGVRFGLRYRSIASFSTSAGSPGAPVVCSSR